VIQFAWQQMLRGDDETIAEYQRTTAINDFSIQSAMSRFRISTVICRIKMSVAQFALCT